jgi:ribosomal protein S27AE
MGLGRSWARLVERRRERKRERRRNRRMRGRRVRLTWKNCRRCGSGSFLPANADRVCEGCLSLR